MKTRGLSRAAARTVLAWVDEALAELKDIQDENIRRRAALAHVCGRLEAYAGESHYSARERGKTESAE